MLICSLHFVLKLENLGFGGGGGRDRRTQGSTPCVKHCLKNAIWCGNLGGGGGGEGDSFEGNTSHPPSLYETCLKYIRPITSS